VVAWDRDVARIDVFHKCSQQVILVVTKTACPTWVLFGIYASTCYKENKKLWQEVSVLINKGIPTAAMDDFNCITRTEEKRGRKPFAQNITTRKFNQFLDTNGLLNLDFVGSQFTGCNNRSRGARIWERLDRVVATRVG